MRQQRSPILNHIAVLTSSVERSAASLNEKGLQVGPAQEFPGEGTKEIYVGDLQSQRSLLLLMEPIATGSYQQALSKRGPGLHHLAIDVSSLNEFIHSLTGTGWFLLPQSVKSITEQKTAWLARPGFPALIEVQEREDMAAREDALISCLEIPNLEKFDSLIAALQVSEFQPSKDQETWFVMKNGERIPLSQLFGQDEEI